MERELLDDDRGRKLSDVRARHEDELLRYPNVVGVATGTRTRRGEPTEEACLVVYVERKVPAESLASGELLPAEIEGVPVDVVATGRSSLCLDSGGRPRDRGPSRSPSSSGATARPTSSRSAWAPSTTDPQLATRSRSERLRVHDVDR